MTNYILKTQVKQCIDNVSNQGWRKEYVWKDLIDIYCFVEKKEYILDYNVLTKYIIDTHLNYKMKRWVRNDRKETTIIIFLLNELKTSMRLYKTELKRIVKVMNQ